MYESTLDYDHSKDAARAELNAGEFRITRVRLNSGGYDKYGTYFGVGQPLFHVSRSGMMRHVAAYTVVNGETVNITQQVAQALLDKIAADGGIRCAGCGSDAGFDLVYNLGATLWPNGTPEPHGLRNGVPDSTGGYALKQRWL